MADEELRELLKRNLEENKDNNRLLRKIVRVYRWQMFFSLVKWSIIIGSAFGLYYFFQPYLDNLTNTYSEIRQSLPSWPVNGLEDVMPR